MFGTTQFDTPATAEDFYRINGKIQAQPGYREPILWAIGAPVYTGGPEPVLASVRFPVVNGPKQNQAAIAILQSVLELPARANAFNARLTIERVEEALRLFSPFIGDGKPHGNIAVLQKALVNLKGNRRVVLCIIYDDVPPYSVEDSTLKLYALSNRLFRPNQLNLTKIFAQLPNVAWVGDRPMDEEEVESALMSATFELQPFAPHMVDKFPLYVHRINAMKMGVRITDQHKVRLGAYLGEGTTLMPGASYINFNAGTEGDSMVEGRISSAAFVGKGTAVGGGASMLGTLSGGNEVPISTGRNCLLEINSGLGIPVGDAVIIGAGCQVTASTLVAVHLPGHPKNNLTVKASELVDINAVTFRVNSGTGQTEVVRTRRNEEFAKKLEDGESILNADLHAHN